MKNLLKTYPTPLAAGLTVLLIIAGVWYAASRPNQRVIGAMDNLAQLTENIRRNYKNRPDYWGLSTENVIQKQIAPSAMLRDGRPDKPGCCRNQRRRRRKRQYGHAGHAQFLHRLQKSVKKRLR